MGLFWGIIILIFLLIAVQLNAIITFGEEHRYIKMEISRSLDENKRKSWKKELKKLYFGSVPVIGKFLKKLFG